MPTSWETVDRVGEDSGDKSEDEYIWIVHGAATQTDCAIELVSATPATIGLLKRNSAKYKELSPGKWRATVRYVSDNHPERKESNNQPSQPVAPVRIGTPGKWSRSCQLGNTRVNVAHFENRFPSTAIDRKGLIEWDQTSGAKGTDKFAMAKEWVFEKCIAYGDYDEAWLEGIDACDLTVNQDDFFWMKGYSALFLGANLIPEEACERVVMRFLVGKNEDNITVAGITGVYKGAHEYLWAHYKPLPVADGTGKKLITGVIDSIYVDELYPAADWEALENFVGSDAIGGPT